MWIIGYDFYVENITFEILVDYLGGYDYVVFRFLCIGCVILIWIFLWINGWV